MLVYMELEDTSLILRNVTYFFLCKNLLAIGTVFQILITLKIKGADRYEMCFRLGGNRKYLHFTDNVKRFMVELYDNKFIQEKIKENMQVRFAWLCIIDRRIQSFYSFLQRILQIAIVPWRKKYIGLRFRRQMYRKQTSHVKRLACFCLMNTHT